MRKPGEIGLAYAVRQTSSSFSNHAAGFSIIGSSWGRKLSGPFCVDELRQAGSEAQTGRAAAVAAAGEPRLVQNHVLYRDKLGRGLNPRRAGDLRFGYQRPSC